VGDDEALMAVIEVDGVEPPELEADFPVSVAIVLPDKTAASLVGDFYSVQQVNGRDFRVSPGIEMTTSPAGMELVVATVLRYAGLTGEENVVELYSGAGTLTAFLAEQVGELVAVERNPDAVADLAVNLNDLDNVNVFEGEVETVLPMLPEGVDLMVAHPWANGLSRQAIAAIIAARPIRFRCGHAGPRRPFPGQSGLPISRSPTHRHAATNFSHRNRVALDTRGLTFLCREFRELCNGQEFIEPQRTQRINEKNFAPFAVKSSTRSHRLCRPLAAESGRIGRPGWWVAEFRQTAVRSWRCFAPGHFAAFWRA
jgi:hypothetical protein